MIPAIDHSLISPNGRMSKRAREAAIKREAERLFPKGFFDAPKKTEQEIAKDKAETLRRAAANLRDLAKRGMQTRKFTREAEQLEKEADGLCIIP